MLLLDSANQSIQGWNFELSTKGQAYGSQRGFSAVRKICQIIYPSKWTRNSLF